MIKRLLSAAFVAGFLAAVVATGLQFVLTTPLILQAETYETQAGQTASSERLPIVLAHLMPVHGGADHAHEAEPDAWQPGEGLPRMAFTGLATLLGGIGYALLFGAVMLALRREPTLPAGLALGIAGFAVVALAPAVGLPPELPGMPAAPLGQRQAWWIATVLATGVGLYLIAVRRSGFAIVAGIALIVAPHLVGAPHAVGETRVPATLATQFAARSLAISFVLWALIGLCFSWAWTLFGERRADA